MKNVLIIFCTIIFSPFILAGAGIASDVTKMKFEQAVFASGCFWCGEAVFEQLKGVQSVENGYTGGTTKNPTYEEVCAGNTGHAEAIRITFDPSVIRYEELLTMFWRSHDPTTLNRQGADVGTQYRSAIFYCSQTQKEQAEISKRSMQQTMEKPIVTEITEATTFYPAEVSHQDYYRNNPNAGYCRFVIQPKLKKLGLQ